MKNGKRLPAIFIENRIFLQPKTKTGVTLILITDSAGGRGIMTTKGVEKAGLPKMIEIEEFFTVELPEIVEDHWIPPLINDGKKAPLLVYDGGNEWEKNIAKEFDGQLGVTWFGNRIWTLDYLNQEMIYNENIDLSETDKKYCVPLSFPKNELGQLKYHYARIQAEINGEVLDFLFDIGPQFI